MSWWLVWYEPLATRAPGTANSRYTVVQAASQSDITADSVGGAITKIQGPYSSQSAATNAAGVGPLPGTGSQTNVQTSGGANVNFPNPLSAVTGIWDKINSRSTWIRIAEGVLGISLILVALAHFSGVKPAQIAKKVIK